MPRNCCRAFVGLAAGLALHLVPPAGVRADVIPFAYAADMMDGWAGNPRDGVPDSLFLSNRASLFQTWSDVLNETRGFVKFGISSVSPLVSHAELSLPVYRSLGPYPQTVAIYGYNAPGQFGYTDWNRGTLVSRASYRGGPALTVDVTDFVRRSAAAGARAAAFDIRFDDIAPVDANAPYIAFQADANASPTLVVTQPPVSPHDTPEPGGLAILGVGVAAALRLWQGSRTGGRPIDRKARV